MKEPISNKRAALQSLVGGAAVAGLTFAAFLEGKAKGAQELQEQAEKAFFTPSDKPSEDLVQQDQREDLPPTDDPVAETDPSDTKTPED